MNSWEALGATLGMAAISLLCRSFFLLPRDDLPLPRWLREASFAGIVAGTQAAHIRHGGDGALYVYLRALG